MKRLIVFLVVFVILCFFPKPTYAAQNFSVSSDVTYRIEENGLTHTEFKILLKNKTSKYYASSYKINVGFENIKNIQTYDSEGSIDSKINKSTGGNSIEVIFGDKVVGKDKSYQFTLSFDTGDVIQNQGNVWELNIPGISNQHEFEDFNVRVIVPKSFGEPTYIKPSTTVRGNSSDLLFTKDELQKSGISLAFGKKQIYAFSLVYNLKNSNFFPIVREVALPPSTNYQDVYFDSLDPKPQQVTKDADGNWIALYNLSPRESKIITAKGLVEINLVPKADPLDKKDYQRYLTAQNYWEKDRTEIQKIAKELKTPQNIYKYVVDHLTYDFSRVSNNKPRIGAIKALQNPSSAVCLEFTDLFIALSRAAGIPAREVNGFAYTQNSTQRPLSATTDILHAWPEYYDADLKTWVMVDPTWSNTTGGVDYFHILDFDHFTFVKKGISSVYPIPAGGYKDASAKSTKDISITFSRTTPQGIFRSDVSTQLEESYMAGFSIAGSVVVTNQSNTILPSQTIQLTTTKLTPMQQALEIPSIPPFGYVSSGFSYKAAPFLTKENDILTITVGNKQWSYPVVVIPFVFSKKILTILGGIICVIFIAVISSNTIRTRRL